MKAIKPETLLGFFGTLIYLFLLLPIFLIWIPNRILSSPEYSYSFNAGVFKYFGIAPIVIGLAIYIWCSISFVFHGKGSPIPFTPTKRLVVKGLYRFVRNPLYIAGSLVFLGEALLFQSVRHIDLLFGDVCNFQYPCFHGGKVVGRSVWRDIRTISQIGTSLDSTIKTLSK